MKIVAHPAAPMPSRSLACESCGTTFGCDRDGACWCMDEAFRVPMPAEGSSADCLCPICLRALASVRKA